MGADEAPTRKADKMASREVELIDGRTVRVYLPPYTRIHESVRKRLPEPQPPVVTERTAAGKEINMVIKDDPQYLQKHVQWDEAYIEQVDMMSSLFMFKDVQVPEEWDVGVEVGAEMSYFEPDWKPREGEMGRKLDYIQWNILADTMNAQRVTQAVAEMSGIDLNEVSANEATFRSDVEGQAA